MPKLFSIVLTDRDNDLQNEIVSILTPYAEIYIEPALVGTNEIKLIVQIRADSRDDLANEMRITYSLLQLRDRLKGSARLSSLRIAQLGDSGTHLEKIDKSFLIRFFAGARCLESPISRSLDSSLLSDAPNLPQPSRFLQARLPMTVQLGNRVMAQVRVALQPDDGRSALLRPLKVPPEGIEVLLILHSPGFVPRSDAHCKVHVPPEADSDWAIFEIEAQQSGVHNLEVTAFREGVFIGSISLQVIVNDDIATGSSTNRNSPITMRQRESGEITLQIHYDAAQSTYRYQLIDSTIGGLEETRSNPLLRTPQEAVEDLVRQLNRMARNTQNYTTDQTRQFLKGKGIELWTEFIPEDLQRLFWERRDRISRMIILSSGDPVPWEVLYPFAPDSFDAGFLAEQFPIARWVFGAPPVSSLHLSKPVFVLPDGSPPTAEKEVNILRGMFSKEVLNSLAIKDLDGLLSLFSSAKFDLLHFACHNTFRPEEPTASSVIMGQQPFQPVFLHQHRERFRASSPVVFMNACRTDGQAPNYTKLAGWARRFLETGAGAFIGSLWEVRDQTASLFAQEFYRALFDGTNLGDAVKKAREAVMNEPADPTWLAYTLYGDPAATLNR